MVHYQSVCSYPLPLRYPCLILSSAFLCAFCHSVFQCLWYFRLHKVTQLGFVKGQHLREENVLGICSPIIGVDIVKLWSRFTIISIPRLRAFIKIQLINNFPSHSKIASAVLKHMFRYILKISFFNKVMMDIANASTFINSWKKELWSQENLWKGQKRLYFP